MALRLRVSAIVALALCSYSSGVGAASSEPRSTPAPEPQKPKTLLGVAPPYLPRQTEYSLELGWMRADEDLFAAAASVGFHLGTCMFSRSETCQQYADALAGFAVREAQTYGDFWGSLRWQYVNLPDRYSPFWRVFGGTSYVRHGSEIGWHPVVGGGVGVTTYLHEKVDLRLEIRAGYIDQAFAQGVMGFQIKADRLLQTFADQLKRLGYGTVETVFEATGTAVQATGEGIGGIVEGVSSPFRSDETKEPIESGK